MAHFNRLKLLGENTEIDWKHVRADSFLRWTHISSPRIENYKGYFEKPYDVQLQETASIQLEQNLSD